MYVALNPLILQVPSIPSMHYCKFHVSGKETGSGALIFSLLSRGRLLQGVISAKSVWELFIGVKKVCDKICQKLQYKVLFMAKIALNKSYGGNNG